VTLQSRPWFAEVRRIALGALVLFAVGYLVGSPEIALLAGAVAYLAWHLRQLYVLQQWLEHRKQRPRPQARGAWVPVLDSLERLNRQSRKRKRRLRNFVRRFEHAAAAFPDAAAVLRRTVLRGPRLPLLLELPPYRVPVWSNIFLVAWRRTRKFLEDAGTVILTMTVILWALLSYPHSSAIDARYDEARAEVLATTATTDAAAQEEQLAELAGQQAGEQLRYSLGGRLGQVIEPTIEPLGFDWRIGVGIIGAFAAREVFVSTLGIVFGIEEADEESVSLRESLQNATHADGSPLMTPLAGVSLMVFFVLACQCMSTIVVVRREAGGWYWPIFMFGYMSVLAYVASLVVYQVGSALGWGV